MKSELATINQIIAIMENAKKMHGGSHRVQIYDRHGDKIRPKGHDLGATVRGSTYLPWVEFSEEITFPNP